MKISKIIVVAALLGCQVTLASAQFQKPLNSASNGNRAFNPFHTEFKRAWDLPLTDPVKLIEVGPVTEAHKSNLLLLLSGPTAADSQRQLRILHWNEPRFLIDTELPSQSLGNDSLLIGHFRPAEPGVTTPRAVPAGQKPQKKKQGTSGLQVLTNAGLFVWSDNTLSRLATVPQDVKQAISIEGHNDMMLIGAGDGTTPYEFVESELRPLQPTRLSGNGYPRFGIGTQEFPGSDKLNLAPGVRYAQCIWSSRAKWIVGIVRGTSSPTPEAPNATTGDRIVVYTPKFANRDKTFWETRFDDLEEAWRSEPLTGRILDLRIGDPKNEGKPGILILSAENKDKDRRLVFYAISGVG